MEDQPSFPSVSIPCHDEQRDKKKRYTVCKKKKKKNQLINIYAHVLILSWPSFQVYKVIVSVGEHEWFVFRRYAEFDKLYNTVSIEISACCSNYAFESFTVIHEDTWFSTVISSFCYSYENSSHL